jgi:hypothetical protein
MIPITYLDHLQKVNSGSLAFYPRDRLESDLAAGRVIACEDNGEPAGYLWHGPVHHGRDVTVYQACVDFDARRQHLGLGMVEGLIAAARTGGATGVRLRCRSSIEANAFWRELGFYCVNVTPGGVRRGAMLNHYRLDLMAPLFVVDSVSPSTQANDHREYRALKRLGVPMPSRFSRTA